MFRDYDSSLSTQQTNHSFLFTELKSAYCLVIQQYFYRNLLFVNNSLLVNSSPPPPPRLLVRPSGESVTTYVTLLLIEFGQPCLDPIHVLRISVSALRERPREGPWLYRNAQTGISQKIRKVSTSVVVVQTGSLLSQSDEICCFNPYPTAFPYANGMFLHFYQQQENSTTKTVHKVINKGLKTYV